MEADTLQNQAEMTPLQAQLQEEDRILRQEFLKIGKKAVYGTAGFRDLATRMPFVVFRVGIFVAVLNKTFPSKCLGVVISASHNKREDNGVKITNFRGNMLEREYEPRVQEFVNEESVTIAIANLKAFLVTKGLTVFETEVTVLIGGDTRPSTAQFLGLLEKGVRFEGGKTVNFGLTTTPQLQFYVYLYNEKVKPKHVGETVQDPEELRAQYWEIFSNHFTACTKYIGWREPIARTVDCANGVGGRILPHFTKLIQKYLQVEVKNATFDEYLNKNCGADHVKTHKEFPMDFEPRKHNSFVSFDGDADRIVFYTEKDSQLQLIDGDRIGTVMTEFFKRLTEEMREKTKKLNECENLFFNIPENPTIGFVQTYYANYSSSDYLRSKYGMEPVFAATGVKYLHEKAEHYDIGIYFEANGHGTVIFRDKYLERIDALAINKQFLMESDICKNEKTKAAVEEYFLFVQFYMSACRIANPAVGDAISIMLLFEVALKYLKYTFDDTLKLYSDLESLTSKIAVRAKENLKVTEIQDKVVEPAGLQKQMEKVLKKHSGKKAFLRASGTENVLRLHVEAETKEQVKQITSEITAIVQKCKQLN